MYIVVRLRDAAVNLRLVEQRLSVYNTTKVI